MQLTLGRLKNPRHEALVNFYVLGHPARPPAWLEQELTPEELAGLPPQTQHNATQSLIAAGYSARGASARSYASQLLTRSDIQRRIEELREKKLQMDNTARFRWGEMVPEAQRALRRALRRDDASAVAAAKYIIDRAEGPVGMHFKERKKEGKSGYPVLVLGYSDRSEPPASFEPYEN